MTFMNNKKQSGQYPLFRTIVIMSALLAVSLWLVADYVIDYYKSDKLVAVLEQQQKEEALINDQNIKEPVNNEMNKTIDSSASLPARSATSSATPALDIAKHFEVTFDGYDYYRFVNLSKESRYQVLYTVARIAHGMVPKSVDDLEIVMDLDENQDPWFKLIADDILLIQVRKSIIPGTSDVYRLRKGESKPIYLFTSKYGPIDGVESSKRQPTKFLFLIGGGGEWCGGEGSVYYYSLITGNVKNLLDYYFGCIEGKRFIGIDNQDHLLVGQSGNCFHNHYSDDDGDCEKSVININVIDINPDTGDTTERVLIAEKDMPAIVDKTRIIFDAEQNWLTFIGLESIQRFDLETRRVAKIVDLQTAIEAAGFQVTPEDLANVNDIFFWPMSYYALEHNMFRNLDYKGFYHFWQDGVFDVVVNLNTGDIESYDKWHDTWYKGQIYASSASASSLVAD